MQGMGRQERVERGGLRLLLAAAVTLTGCVSGVIIPPSPKTVSQSYVGVKTNVAGQGALNTYAIDRSAMTFTQTGFNPGAGDQAYILNSGSFATLSQGILGISVTYSNVSGPTTLHPAKSTSWAIELPGQGSLVQLAGDQFSAQASNQTCPAQTTAQNFNFVAVPSQLNTTPSSAGFRPTMDAAYGTFAVAAQGGAVTFSNVSQSTLPGSGGAVVNPSPSSVMGACSGTLYGQTISVPTTTTITNPGGSQTASPTATIALSPGGFLVEDNGLSVAGRGPGQNLLGAGFGAIGMAQPAAALMASDVIGRQYGGFLYSSGAVAGGVAPISRVASFNLPGQSACAGAPAQSGTVLYGGEFAANDPSVNAAGNSDFAIDLGAQDTKNPGLFPAATVYVCGSFSGNAGGKGSTYSFAAVAEVGSFGGKDGIAVIGLDARGTPNQLWGIYLLQTN